jgi:hypothetical protein
MRIVLFVIAVFVSIASGAPQRKDGGVGAIPEEQSTNWSAPDTNGNHVLVLYFAHITQPQYNSIHAVLNEIVKAAVSGDTTFSDTVSRDYKSSECHMLALRAIDSGKTVEGYCRWYLPGDLPVKTRALIALVRKTIKEYRFPDSAARVQALLVHPDGKRE